MESTTSVGIRSTIQMGWRSHLVIADSASEMQTTSRSGHSAATSEERYAAIAISTGSKATAST
jgi:hypothetical protein